MLDIVLRILTVLGIILLILLGVLVLLTLLVLFFPVSYRLNGGADERGLRLSARAKWLFGFLRMEYAYPESKHLVVKALWFTIYSVGNPLEKGQNVETDHLKKRKKSKKKKTKNKRREVRRETAGSALEEENGKEEVGTDERGEMASDFDMEGNGAENIQPGNADGGEDSQNVTADVKEDEQPEGLGKISQKFTKIKYTIYNIYDKIKKIWENISYYIALFREEETRLLLGHARLIFGRILKSVRPRRIRANVLFGTGSPDTTGYLYGGYCALTAWLGVGFLVRPDFERAVLEGDFDIAGRVTLGILLINVLKLVLDRRMRRVLKKMKI